MGLPKGIEGSEAAEGDGHVTAKPRGGPRFSQPWGASSAKPAAHSGHRHAAGDRGMPLSG